MRTYRAASQGLILAAIAVAVAISSCAEGVVVHTAANPGASFEQYRSFSFGPAEGPPGGYHMSARSQEVQRRLQPVIASTLQQRGYAPASGKGDFFIMYGSGRREVARHEESAVADEWLPDDESADFVEGSVVIDAFDGATGRRIWHGASQAQIDPDHVDDGLLGRTVGALLGSFPRAAPRAQ
jgi:hypothetical protein